MIQVELEDAKELKKWGMGLSHIIEACVFCQKGTRYWHNATNKTVCLCCAERFVQSDLEDPNAAWGAAETLSRLLRNVLGISRKNRFLMPRIPFDWQDRAEYALMKGSVVDVKKLAREIVDAHAAWTPDPNTEDWLTELRNFVFEPEKIAA